MQETRRKGVIAWGPYGSNFEGWEGEEGGRSGCRRGSWLRRMGRRRELGVFVVRREPSLNV